MIDPNNSDFKAAMLQMKNFHQVCQNKGLNEWAVRAALMVTLQIGKRVAMRKGIKAEELDMQDIECIEYANSLNYVGVL